MHYILVFISFSKRTLKKLFYVPSEKVINDGTCIYVKMYMGMYIKHTSLNSSVDHE